MFPPLKRAQQIRWRIPGSKILHLVIVGAGMLMIRAQAAQLHSPDELITAVIQVPAADSGKRPTWSATFHGGTILDGCALGLHTARRGDLMAGARIVD